MSDYYDEPHSDPYDDDWFEAEPEEVEPGKCPECGHDLGMNPHCQHCDDHAWKGGQLWPDTLPWSEAEQAYYRG